MTRRPVLETRRRVQKTRHLPHARDDGQLAGVANEAHPRRGRALRKRHLEEEPERRHRGVQAANRDTAGGQMQPVARARSSALARSGERPRKTVKFLTARM